MSEALLTAEQVAQIFAVKPQTIRDAAWRGRIPCVRLWQGKKRSLLRFRREDIDALIKSGTADSR